ncbi:glycosyltransferase family 9 protein [Mangrovibacterium marinum]|uniref:ADP-heptose:LPS heptosyltransferase n=1 Tax=Mangrovibacterium marinum TaxID=1639118 RepID=A0A2T5C5I0_9BACT|nr:glycosyltransferase family 9 protein [Mangrovibacterium marinum]PTN10170.1 ADP-heptose:LPS heptosyltransferase [Mangrovibacterium marinum]
MKTILVYSYAGLSEIVRLLPVLKGVLESNKDLEIYLLTQPFLFPVFEGIERLYPVTSDLKRKHKGVTGLFRLYKRLKSEINPDEVFDLHQVLRTFILNSYFRAGGVKVHAFRKGRVEKRQAVKNKSHRQLPSTIDRYAAAFSEAGYRFILPQPPLFRTTPREQALQLLTLDAAKVETLIGIAPFAKHRQKVWGVDKIRELLGVLRQVPKAKVVLFGGGKAEMEILDSLAAEFDHCLVAAHHINFAEELQVLPHLDVMLSMDSANMHLAAMAGVPVVSVWGGTHPSLGFAPYHQSDDNLIQYNGPDIACRPCSVFGNKKCIYGDVRCMQYISVKQVADRIAFILNRSLQ